MATMLPTGMLPGLLSPEQEAQVRQQAQQNALLNFGLQALAGSQAVGYKPSTLQVLGQAGQAGLQGYQGTFDQQLQNMLRQQQMAEAQRKQQAEAQRQQQIEALALSAPKGQRDLARLFPQQYAETMFREPKVAPGVVGEYNAAIEAGLISPDTTLGQYVALKKPPGTTVNVGGERDPFDVDIAKEQAKVFSQISSAGKTATSNLRRINRLENILNKVETGGAAAFKQAAGSLGIKTEGVEDIQAATAIINSLVPEQRAEGSGPMSDADLELFKQSLPRIINQPGGNKLIIEGMKEINQYLIKESEIANDVIAKRITRDEGRRKLLELNNPIEDFFGQSQPATPQGVTVRRIR